MSHNSVGHHSSRRGTLNPLMPGAEDGGYSQMDAEPASGKQGSSSTWKIVVAVMAVTILALVIAVAVIASRDGDGGNGNGNGNGGGGNQGASPPSPPSPIVIVQPTPPTSAPTPVPTGPLPTVPMPANGALPASSPRELLVAVDAADDSSVLARSYDGMLWEAVTDELRSYDVAVRCDADAADACRLDVDGGRAYKVQALPVPNVVATQTASDAVARALTQGGFGASKADITEMLKRYSVSGRRRDAESNEQAAALERASPVDLERWIADQQDTDKTPMTSLRAYLRARQNPRVTAAAAAGGVRPACSVGSRWHRFALATTDIGELLNVRVRSGLYELSVNGEVRTTVKSFAGKTAPAAPAFTVARVCKVVERINGTLSMSDWTSTTRNKTECELAKRPQNVKSTLNPAIEFATAPAGTWAPSQSHVRFADVAGRADMLVTEAVLNEAGCPAADAKPLLLSHSSSFWRFDPRLALTHNTLDDPSSTTVQADTTVTCPAVQRNFLNEATCVRRASCSGLVTESHNVTLSVANQRLFYTAGGRFVYTVRGLRLSSPYNKSPCSLRRSRWARSRGACSSPTAVAEPALTTLTTRLMAAKTADPNPTVIDLYYSPVSADCPVRTNQIGASLTVGNECLTHVHEDEYSVRDFSVWVDNHDGNEAAKKAGRRNPISAFAIDGKTEIWLPSNHPMTRWRDRRRLMTLIGRFGEEVDFDSFDSALQSEAIASAFGAVLKRSSDVGYEACGSPQEVANNGTAGNRYMFYDVTPTPERLLELDWRHDQNDGKRMVWLNAVTNRDRVPPGKDEDVLRQRTAWALSQIVTLGQGITVDGYEPWVNYYDIFVRHAFGSYRDIIKEVSFSPMMSRYLSFWRNKAIASSGTFPDENYSREIMQLYTVGLFKQYDDGRLYRTSSGDAVPMYTAENIADMARVWTGFDDAVWRGNFEMHPRSGANYVDPSQLKPTWHDDNPKADLDSGFIGDGYPVCTDLPAKHWLSRGATYELTGESSVEGSALDGGAGGYGKRPRFEVADGSQLFSLLCAKAQGKCTFPSKVVLTRNLQCASQMECDAGRVRSVKVVDAAANVTRYYWYKPVPCVRMAFFGEGQVVKNGASRVQCANRHAAVGTPACCSATNNRTQVSNYTAECLFAAEATTADKAQQRCESLGQVLCNNTGGVPYANFQRACASSVFAWAGPTAADAACALQTQVYPDSGRISVIDPLAPQSFKHVAVSSNAYFRVRWLGKPYPVPNASGVCVDAGCTTENATSGSPTCMCSIEVERTAVFTPSSSVPTSSLLELANALPVGAASPESFPTGEYTECTSAACASLSSAYGGAVKVHVNKNAAADTWPTSTIFELPSFRAGGATRYRANYVETVYVGGTAGDKTRAHFRNPPTFNTLAGEQYYSSAQWTTDRLQIPSVEAEIDAAIDHLVEHNNTAVFVAYRMIQRMVTSNPSARYIESVVRAFRSGTHAGKTYSGRYGCMAATVAAVLLDQEARSSVVEADPRGGMLREPILKIVHLLRALEFRTFDGRELMLPAMYSRLGQGALTAPSVFGFYLPEFMPAGRIGSSGLVGPEFEIATSPKIINWLNAVSSLVDNGLTACDGGLGYNYGRSCGTLANKRRTADGNLTYTPTAVADPSKYGHAIVDELALLLTSGRASTVTRERLTKEYEAVLALGGEEREALGRVIKLFALSQEFHTTATRLPTVPRPPPPGLITGRGRPYKALVVIFQNGGADSWNVAVPHSGCTGKDMYAEYAAVRTLGALTKSQLQPIDVTGQQCSKFGVHESMPAIKKMYDNGDASFLLNIGALVEPVTKDDYRKKSGRVRRFPPSLFSHNIMQRSMHNVDAQNAAAKGVLGRTVGALLAQASPYKSELYSLAGNQKMLEGAPGKAADIIDANSGVQRWAEYREFSTSVASLTENTTRSTMADTWADLLSSSIEKTERLGADLATVSLSTTFPTHSLGRQFTQIAKLVKYHTESTDTERAVFVAQRGGYDTHATHDLSSNFGDVDTAAAAFESEMRAINHWDDVAVLTVSDFGRTLTSNGAGTDHAWGGIHTLYGGAVRGGRVHGEYPDDLTIAGSLVLDSRGKLVPTSSWESVWKGLVQWLGVEASQMADVLPNLANFESETPQFVYDQQKLMK